MDGLEVRRLPYDGCEYPNCDGRAAVEVVLRGHDLVLRLCNFHGSELGQELIAKTNKHFL